MLYQVESVSNPAARADSSHCIPGRHALSIISLSFSGFAGESSAGDFQDCGVSSMILMGDWMSHPGILLVLKVHLLEAAEICSYTVQGEEEEKKVSASYHAFSVFWKYSLALTVTFFFRYLHGNKLTGVILPELGNMSKFKIMLFPFTGKTSCDVFCISTNLLYNLLFYCILPYTFIICFLLTLYRC